jgi:serine/threonine-protein kinase
MAPEGVDGGGALTTQSDVYSLGCVAFFLLTGELTFHASSVLQMAMKHMEEAPRAPSAVRPDNGITPELDARFSAAEQRSRRPAGHGVALLTQLIPIANAMPVGEPDWPGRWDRHVPVSPTP